MKYAILLSLILTIGISSCKKLDIEGTIITDTKFAAELRASPESVKIGDNNLVLTTYLWRDFMPSAEKNGSKMLCVNKLTEVDGRPFLNNISLRKQYVVKGNEIWAADYVEIRNSQNFILEGVVRDGPKWGPNIEVDVVCEFEYLGTRHKIIGKSQLIHKTE